MAIPRLGVSDKVVRREHINRLADAIEAGGGGGLGPRHVYAESDPAITTASADIAAPLQALLNTYAKVEFRGSGTYTTGPLTVPTGTTLIIPEGVTLKLKNGANEWIFLIYGTGRVVGEGTLDGNRANQTALDKGGAYVVNNGRVKGLTVINAAGHGVLLDGERGQAIELDVSACGRFGIWSKKSRQKVTGCDVANTSLETTGVSGYAGIRIEGAAATGGNNRTHVLGNTVTLPANGPICIELWGIALGDSTGAVVSANTTSGGLMGISVDKQHSASVTTNTVSGFAAYGLELASSQHCALATNTVDGLNGTDTRGISCSNTSNSHNAITGNTVRRCVSKGLHVFQGADYAITGNIIREIGGNAMDLQSTPRCSVTGNRIDGAGGTGISWTTPNNGSLTGNVITNCAYGIDLWFDTGTMDNVTVTGNSLAATVPFRPTVLGGTLGNNITIRANPGLDRDYLDYKNNIIDITGTGTPEAVVTAGIGSVFHRRDGGASTSLYVKTSGVGNTGWTGK